MIEKLSKRAVNSSTKQKKRGGKERNVTEEKGGTWNFNIGGSRGSEGTSDITLLKIQSGSGGDED